MARTNLDEKLLDLSPRDPWTLADACEGTVIFGGNGSGKTSGSGKDVAKAFLSRGYGGLVLTAKVDEAARWVSYAHQTGRVADLVSVEPGGRHGLNFLDYEAGRSGRGAGLTYELVRLLQTAMDGGRERGRGGDPYWDEAVAELLTNAIDLAVMSGERLSLSGLAEVVRGMPATPFEAETLGCMDPARLAWLQAHSGGDWARSSACAEVMRRAEANVTCPERRGDLRETFSYFLRQMPGLAPETRGCVVGCLMSRLSALLRSPFRQLFGGATTVRPEDTFGGKVVVLNLPVKEFGEAGRFGQVLFKTVWQRAVERRGGDGVPVFLWADEAQFFVTRYDLMFQQTARSSRAASVYLTQSVVNLRAAMDGGADGRTLSEGLLGNLQTKVFHANACPETNEYAERLFGQDLQGEVSAGTSGSGATTTVTRRYLPVLPAIRFTTLRKGGRANGGVVEGYAFQAGKRWQGADGRHGKNYLLARFTQDQEAENLVS